MNTAVFFCAMLSADGGGEITAADNYARDLLVRLGKDVVPPQMGIVVSAVQTTFSRVVFPPSRQPADL